MHTLHLQKHNVNQLIYFSTVIENNLIFDCLEIS